MDIIHDTYIIHTERHLPLVTPINKVFYSYKVIIIIKELLTSYRTDMIFMLYIHRMIHGLDACGSPFDTFLTYHSAPYKINGFKKFCCLHIRKYNFSQQVIRPLQLNLMFLGPD